MRWSVLVGLVACHGHQARAPEPTPAVEAAAPAVPAAPEPGLHCSPPRMSGVAGKDPRDGGYRLLADDGAIEAVRARIRASMGTHATRELSRQTADALMAAIGDLRAQVQRCMSHADPVTPGLQYELVATTNGNLAASLVYEVSVRRVDGVNADHTPVLVATQAEPCLKALLTHIELPPSGTLAELHTFVRYDYCTVVPPRTNAP